MLITVSFLGVILCLLIAIFIINKRRIVSFQYTPEFQFEGKKQGILRLLTYNVAGLPENISSAKTKRYDSMLQIGEEINHYDMVNVQEDFNYNIQLYSKNSHPFKTAHRGKAIWGDGLNTFSIFPILEFRRVAWHRCNSTDCLTPKGFSLARIRIENGVEIDLYNVHATSGNSVSAARARRRNMLQLAQFILDNSAKRPLVVMGDFNAHYQFELDNMFDFMELTNLQDSWVSTILQGKYPEVQPNFDIIPDLDRTDQTESIDKILYRNSVNLIFTPLKYKIEVDNFRDANGLHLSDHLAVMTDLQWQHISG